ncbi:MAG: enterochelin esterase [Propionibacteriaceae bacterium]|nr:enterochelin esterase [Propionibacteriaceae bacterium]
MSQGTVSQGTVNERTVGQGTKARPQKLAINRLREHKVLDEATIERFFGDHEMPVVEGPRCTFAVWVQADEVYLRHRVVGLPDNLELRRIVGTDFWYVVVEIPADSRVEYQFELRRGDSWERFNDPRNPRVARSPVGDSSVCYGVDYRVPDWAVYDEESRPGELVEMEVHSVAQRRDNRVTLYLPARFRTSARYPLLVVHDGGDFLEYGSMKTVLDNLIHRLDMAETVVAFTYPGERLDEYPNSGPHARWIAAELVPELEAQFPLVGRPSGRCLMGSSFGAVASLSTAVRYPDTFGSLLLQSGSFVFTDIGDDHGGGPAFDPVVKFVNRYRARPTRVAERLFISCGIYEPLIVSNRSMLPVFAEAGMKVNYVESRDGHNWESWRDRLRDGLSWIYPGQQMFVYE